VFNYVSGSSGTVDLRGYGVPGKQYDVQYANNPNFSPIGGTFGPVTAATGSGLIIYQDTTAGAGPRYYRFAVH
jgi:hypothetical protein